MYSNRKSSNSTICNTNCCVPYCHSKGSKYEDLSTSFHTFPKREKERKLWETILKIGKPPTKHMRVCSKHFVKYDFHFIDKNTKKRRLKIGVVPSLNLPPSPIEDPSKKKEFKGNKRAKRCKRIKKSVSVSEHIRKEATLSSSEEEISIIEEKDPRVKDKLNGNEEIISVSDDDSQSDDSKDDDTDDEDSDETDDADEIPQKEKERALMRKITETIKVAVIDNEAEILNGLSACKPKSKASSKKYLQNLRLEMASIINPPRTAEKKDKPKIKIKEEPIDPTEKPLLPMQLIKCEVDSDSEATLSADESRLYMNDSVDRLGPLGDHTYCTNSPEESSEYSSPIFPKRTSVEETFILYDFIYNGLDKEDKSYLHKSFNELTQTLVGSEGFWIRGIRWTSHPITIFEQLEKKTPGVRTHVTGCARCEGYYKVNVKEKAFSNNSLLMSWSYL